MCKIESAYSRWVSTMGCCESGNKTMKRELLTDTQIFKDKSVFQKYILMLMPCLLLFKVTYPGRYPTKLFAYFLFLKLNYELK